MCACSSCVIEAGAFISRKSQLLLESAPDFTWPEFITLLQLIQTACKEDAVDFDMRLVKGAAGELLQHLMASDSGNTPGAALPIICNNIDPRVQGVGVQALLDYMTTHVRCDVLHEHTALGMRNVTNAFYPSNSECIVLTSGVLQITHQSCRPITRLQTTPPTI